MNVESIPCVFKKRVELRVTDDLRTISEQCSTIDWRNAKKGEVSQESREDLSSLVYNMLAIEDSNTRSSSSKTPLAAWQVCVSAKQHEGGYQLDPQCLDAHATNRTVLFHRKTPQFFAPARCCRNNFTREDLAEEKSCAERDNVKEIRAKSASLVSDQSVNTVQDGGRLHRNTRSASCSPHTRLTFHHSKYTDYYIKNYREQITDDNIRKHIQWRLNELKCNDAVKKPPKKTHEVKSKTIPKPSFTFYRFRISNEKCACDTGILKVGPCPRMPEQSDSKKAGFNINNTSSLSQSKLKTQANMASMAKSKLDQRKETKSVTNLEFQSRPAARRENTISGLDGEGNMNVAKTESNEGKLKKVQLQVHDCSTESPRIVAKGRANRSRARLLGVCMKPAFIPCYRSGSEMSYERRVTRKPTFGEREFLRITTPKPLIRCQSQTPSDFGKSPGFSPEKSVQASPAPSISGTSLRSQVIAQILMKREPQVVFPKNSNFQACITPSNYSTSSVESHIRHRKDGTPDSIGEDLAEDRNHNENRVQRMPSKPSIPRIGPFISG